jgi:hypothetical protein
MILDTLRTAYSDPNLNVDVYRVQKALESVQAVCRGDDMFRKKLMAVIAVAVFGMTMYGAGACALAHEGHDHDEASGTAVNSRGGEGR